MEASQATPPDVLRARAFMLLGLFAASFTLGMVLLFAFEPSVQQDDAAELVARADDARAFLVADYVFIALYGISTPIALWLFGSALEGGRRPPAWIIVAALLLLACAAVDATENTLLLSATGEVSEGAVDTAHALAAPKIALFGAGLVLTIVANVRALQVLRGGSA
jgi:hypothetical protein